MMARPPSRARTADSDKGCTPVLASTVSASSVERSSGPWLVSVVGPNVEGSAVEGSISHGSSVVEIEY